jgi:hypothetical protein
VTTATAQTAADANNVRVFGSLRSLSEHARQHRTK